MPSPQYEIPEGGEHLWEWFWDMNMDRMRDMGTPQPIGPVGIRSWAELSGVTIRPEEVEIIRAMDASYRQVASEIAQPAQQGEQVDD
jgi:hypothetical protein